MKCLRDSILPCRTVSVSRRFILDGICNANSLRLTEMANANASVELEDHKKLRDARTAAFVAHL